MTEETTQAVVDTSNVEPAAQTTEANAQGDDLNTLLAEFEKGTQPQPQPVQTQQQQQPDPGRQALAEVQELRRQQAEMKHQTDLEEFKKVVKGDLDLPDWAVQGFIDEQARKNKPIQDLWSNRDANQSAIKRLAATMHKELARAQGKPRVDQNATEDRAAVSAAVRGASTKTPAAQPPNLGKMSDHEFNQYLKENGINNAV